MMRFFREITKKPWVTDPAVDGGYVDDKAFFLPAPKVGLRVFLAVATMLFSLTLVAYAERMIRGDWVSVSTPGLLWLNTAFLVLSSIAMQWAVVNVRRGHVDGMRNGLYLGGALALAFVAGQLLAWRGLVGSGHYAGANIANAFFYLLTALHGVHVLGGMVAWWRSAARLWRGANAAHLRLGAELCAVYWHYLLLVWLVLFALLLMS